MQERHFLAIHVRAGGRGREHREDEQEDVQRRNSRAFERDLATRGRCGVARNISQNGGTILVCDDFVHHFGPTTETDEPGPAPKWVAAFPSRIATSSRPKLPKVASGAPLGRAA